MQETTAMKIARALPSRVAVIGGGGKTTLMLALAEALAGHNHSVLVTTTTHLAWPSPRRYSLISPKSVEELNGAAILGQITVAGYPAQDHRMVGLPPALFAPARYNYILCEADGSRRLPLKVHQAGEPVIPEGTELVIQVTGLSALGKTVEETVHRYALMNLLPSEIVSPQLIAKILKRGWRYWDGPGITLLNQADTPELCAKADEIRSLLGGNVLFCSLRNEQAPVWMD